jgi:hypothetical protein
MESPSGGQGSGWLTQRDGCRQDRPQGARRSTPMSGKPCPGGSLILGPAGESACQQRGDCPRIIRVWVRCAYWCALKGSGSCRCIGLEKEQTRTVLELCVCLMYHQFTKLMEQLQRGKGGRVQWVDAA